MSTSSLFLFRAAPRYFQRNHCTRGFDVKIFAASSQHRNEYVFPHGVCLAPNPFATVSLFLLISICHDCSTERTLGLRKRIRAELSSCAEVQTLTEIVLLSIFTPFPPVSPPDFFLSFFAQRALCFHRNNRSCAKLFILRTACFPPFLSVLLACLQSRCLSSF